MPSRSRSPSERMSIRSAPDRNGPVGFGRGVADDSLPGVREQVVEGASLDAGSHTTIMWLSALTVYLPGDTCPPTTAPEGRIR